MTYAIHNHHAPAVEIDEEGHMPEPQGLSQGTLGKLRRFFFERLPDPQVFGRKPCIAEDWFVEDARPATPSWLSDDDLRRIWRVARDQRIGARQGAGCPWLLLHQMTDLIDAIFLKWASLRDEQRSTP